jgi:hypothetical protein
VGPLAPALSSTVYGKLKKLSETFPLALQLPFPQVSESMGNHDSKIVDAGSVN